MKIKIDNSIFWILFISPFILLAIIKLLPTFDDWTYFTTPYYDFGNSFRNILLPTADYWRPLDGLFGYLLSLSPTLFPFLNHLTIYLGHIINCILVYKLCKLLEFDKISCNIASIFFFISPAMLGTVLGIDSLNQTYATLWGLLGTFLYVKKNTPIHKIAWIVCTIFAIFSKENGITFFVIPQIIKWGFNRISLKEACKDTLIALAVIIIYFYARYTLYTGQEGFNAEYLDHSPKRIIKNIAVFIGMTWIPTDYVCLVYKPSRNIWIVILTAILTMPFLIYTYTAQKKILINKTCFCLFVSIIAAASPHLVTIFSSMHPYACLGIVAIQIGYLTYNIHNHKIAIQLFIPFVFACSFIDWHHWQKSYESGIIGDNLAKSIIKQSNHQAQKAYIINLDQGEQKYSSFCVIPYEAFGWGYAAKFKNKNLWPKEMKDTTISIDALPNIKQIIVNAGQKGYDAIWYIHGDTANVITTIQNDNK